MRIALVHTDDAAYRSTGYADAWIHSLAEQGADVELVHEVAPEWATGGVPHDRWDLAIPHVLVEEVVAYGPTLKAAALLELCGVPLLNSVSCLVASSDKLVTHAVWAARGVPQPSAWDLERLDAWPTQSGRPLVLKPSYCDGARHISLVTSFAEAHETVAGWREDEGRGGEVRGPAVLQQWIEEPEATVRIFATPEDTSLAYEKSRRPGDLVTHGTVYPKVYEAPPVMAELARRMVATLGGGLMGVDILVDAEGNHFALEANGPFGFDVTDPEQGRYVARAALAVAAAGGRGRTDAVAA